ncbi:MAG: tRNA pseudouridine(13) synthase TruD [Phycisphaerae bacterium]
MTVQPSKNDRGSNLPYLTSNMPGVGGIIKRFDEDFLVEEIPRYAASGSGTHVYFKIEKRGLPTLVAIRRIADRLGRKPNEIGYAGLKDAHGVTRQWLSLEHVDERLVADLSLDGIQVTTVGRHTNKLKLGHLAGNRFVVKIREVIRTCVDNVEAIVAELSRRGVPNYFGPQRFGVRGDNAAVGCAVLRGDLETAISIMLGRPAASDREDVRKARSLFDAGDFSGAADAWPGKLAGNAGICRAYAGSGGDARKAWRSVDHSLRKLYVSSVQSELFNGYLAQSVSRIDRLTTGDVAWKHANGACFLVEDATVEQPRCDAFEISPTGPLFGKKMKEARGAPAALEQTIIEQSGLAQSQIRILDGKKLDGARRPLRVPLKDAAVTAGSDEHGPFVALAFELPPGAYATNVTREICKTLDRYHRLSRSLGAP